MSILDKHPAPWRIGEHKDCVVNGSCVEGEECFHENTPLFVTCGDELKFDSPDVQRLILAAPELLKLAKDVDFSLSEPNPERLRHLHAKTLALIARIEGGNRCTNCMCDAPAPRPKVNGSPVICDCDCHRIEGGK